MEIKQLKRGDVVEVDFGESKGSVQGGKRPAVVIQNDTGNKFSPTTIICPLTTAIKPPIPTHEFLYANESPCLKFNSTFLGEQISTIEKPGILSKWGSLTPKQKACIDTAIIVSLGLQEAVNRRAYEMMLDMLGRTPQNVPARVLN